MKSLTAGFVIAVLFHVNAADAQKMQHSAMQGMEMTMPSMNMSSMVLLTDSMSQEGSGTSWIPVATPMHAFHFMFGRSWPLMVHGALTVRYTDQGANDHPRSADALSSPNWIMAMTQHKLGADDQLAFRLMMSLDRVTEGGDGYPLLFQTGETWEGKPLIDRQHPHDVFGELSASYSHRFNERWSAYTYVGYPGEPAIGPPVYLHRITSPEGGDAPIGHHWQDATHITFGVLTAGLAWRGMVKVEGSGFTGREPDENRWNFDRPKFDSYSGRISISPHKNLAIPLEGEGKWWSNALVWGANKEHDIGTQHSLLFESSLAIHPLTVFSRLELVEKPREDLGISADSARVATIGGANVLAAA